MYLPSSIINDASCAYIVEEDISFSMKFVYLINVYVYNIYNFLCSNMYSQYHVSFIKFQPKKNVPQGSSPPIKGSQSALENMPQNKIDQRKEQKKQFTYSIKKNPSFIIKKTLFDYVLFKSVNLLFLRNVHLINEYIDFDFLKIDEFICTVTSKVCIEKDIASLNSFFQCIARVVCNVAVL